MNNYIFRQTMIIFLLIAVIGISSGAQLLTAASVFVRNRYIGDDGFSTYEYDRTILFYLFDNGDLYTQEVYKPSPDTFYVLSSAHRVYTFDVVGKLVYLDYTAFGGFAFSGVSGDIFTRGWDDEDTAYIDFYLLDSNYRRSRYYLMKYNPDFGGIISVDLMWTFYLPTDPDAVTESERSGEIDDSFKVYPNPSNGSVRVEADQNFPVDIFDISGKLRKRASTKDIINTSDMESGFYIMSVKDTISHKRVNKKITITK